MKAFLLSLFCVLGLLSAGARAGVRTHARQYTVVAKVVFEGGHRFAVFNPGSKSGEFKVKLTGKKARELPEGPVKTWILTLQMKGVSESKVRNAALLDFQEAPGVKAPRQVGNDFKVIR